MLAFLLVFIMIAAMQFFLPKAKPPQQEKPGATPQPTAQTTPVALPTATPKAPRPRPTPKAAAKQATSESETVLENDFYRVTFSNRGAVAKSWILKKYKDQNGKPLDLVNGIAAPVLGYPLSFFSYDKDLETQLNNALYLKSGGTGNSREVSFEYSDGDITARKTFRMEK